MQLNKLASNMHPPLIFLCSVSFFLESHMAEVFVKRKRKIGHESLTNDFDLDKGRVRTKVILDSEQIVAAISFLTGVYD